MADEISVNYGFGVRKGNLVHTIPTTKLVVDMVGTRMMSNVQPLTTGVSGLNVAGATWTPGYGVFVNLSTISGEYLDIGVQPSSTFYPFARLLPQDVATLPLATLSIYAQAGSGTPSLSYVITEH